MRKFTCGLMLNRMNRSPWARDWIQICDSIRRRGRSFSQVFEFTINFIFVG